MSSIEPKQVGSLSERRPRPLTSLWHAFQLPEQHPHIFFAHNYFAQKNAKDFY